MFLMEPCWVWYDHYRGRYRQLKKVPIYCADPVYIYSYKCMYMYIYETYTYIYNAIYILLLITKQGQRILKGWGKNFKCCSVKRNKKMTLSGSFTNHFFSIWAISMSSPCTHPLYMGGKGEGKYIIFIWSHEMFTLNSIIIYMFFFSSDHPPL